MGSLELDEEELLQMVHDFIESESSSSSSSLLSSSSLALKHVHFTHSATYFTLQEILRKKTREERRIEESVRKEMRKRMEMEKSSELMQHSLVNSLKLDGFHASLCHTSWITTPSCPCGNYKYIEVMMIKDEMGKQERIIVDTDFESQFEVARPTQRYKELTSKLPNIFVGSEDKLRRIITILCSAAEESLKERGLHIPPWRRPNYLLSKWKLANKDTIHHKIDIYPTTSGIVASRLGEWVPQDVVIKARKRANSGGSNLSNQFSNMGINCC